MPVKKGNKRIVITIEPRPLQCMDELLALRDPKIHTYSKIINLAIVYFYLAANGYTLAPEENKGVKKDENN